MDKIVTRMQEIDEAATAIVNSAFKMKEDISAQFKEKTTTFDETLMKNTDESLRQLRQASEQSINQSLQSMQQKTTSQIESLETYYQENHQQLADDIVKEILGD